MERSKQRHQIDGLPHEPWVRLENGGDLSRWTHEDEIAYNQANRQTRKYDFFVQAFDFLKENQVVGDYHEYGCHRVRTFRMALTEARRHSLDGMSFYAFDSFEGLPDSISEPSVSGWQKGSLATSEQEFLRIIADHGIYVDKCHTYKGFYSESLSADLQRVFLGRDRIALACIDCDLFESAVPVFSFIEPLLQEGTLLYIDDWFCGYKGSPNKGVARAFLEHERKSRFSFAPHMQIGWWGRSFIAYSK